MIRRFDNLLLKRLPKTKGEYIENAPIGKKTWFRTGGKTDIFCIVYDENELEIILNHLEEEASLFVIGVGSNILIRDGGFRGIIIKLGKSFNKLIYNDDKMCSGASILDSNLSKFAYIKKLKNFE
ncbi:MAG: hypothetical protein VX395_03100, partial [Pseudomonadota bacterium]|nr:hypothetical protein [Pseudomonadota bacterium]